MRIYILYFKLLFVTSILGLFASFFVSENTLLTIKSIENYLMISMFRLIVVYFFYAQYEGKQYKNCSSCQIGNIIGTSAIELAKLSMIFVLNYFILW